jgi:hypothetical protein
MRPIIAALLMVIVIPPIVWIGLAAEYTVKDLSGGRHVEVWELIETLAGGSILALVLGFKESLLGTLAIVGGSRLLIRWKLDSMGASLLLGGLIGLTVFDAPSVLLGLDKGMTLAQAVAGRTWQGCWPYFGVAAAAASALNWRVVIRPLRQSRLASTR